MSLRRVGFSTFCAIGLVLAVGNFRPGTVHAGVGFQPPNPEELKMTSEPLAPGAPAIILYRQVDRDDDHYPPQEEHYLRIKVLTEEGRQRANIEIPFLKDRADVVKIKARTIEADGSIIAFDGEIFEKSLVKARNASYIAKVFTLPNVQVGCILEYYFTIEIKGPYIYGSSWIVNDELFTRNAKFSLKAHRFAGRRPIGSGFTAGPMNLRWSWHALPPGAEAKEDHEHVVRMEVSNIPAFQTEDYMPPANEMKARVDFFYSEAADSNPDSFWKMAGQRANLELESFVGKHKAMDEAVSQIVSPSDSPELKLRKIYDRVQQIRNKSFELQKTQQEEHREKEKADENVEDVWKRGYGNHVQLTWLYLALVRAAGFEAYGAWVSDRKNYFFNQSTMQSWKLDSNVVLVKLNGNDMYFDPGGEFTPFGLLPWSKTGVQGLRLDKDGGTWIKTPLPPSSQSRIERRAELKLSASGDLEGELTLTYTGLEAMYHRLDVRHDDDVTRKKFLEDRAKNQISMPAEATLTNHPDWTGSETPLVAEFDIKVPGWASNAGKRVLIPAGVFTVGEKHIFEHANRVYPIYFDYPYEKVDDVSIQLPAGWQTESLPKASGIDTSLVGYDLKVEAAKDALHLSRTLKVNFMILEQKYYPQLRSFYQIVRSSDEEQIVLQPAVAKASGN
ncbi:MAG: DUF3857 domain-containing protein [Candidatus Sulfotelmatobacter sp.]